MTASLALRRLLALALVPVLHGGGALFAQNASSPLPSGLTPPTPPSVTAPTVSPVSAPTLSGIPGPIPQSPSTPQGSPASSPASSSLALSSLLGDSSNKLVSNLLGIDSDLESSEGLGSSEALGSAEALSSAEALLQRLSGILQSSGGNGSAAGAAVAAKDPALVRAAEALAAAGKKNAASGSPGQSGSAGTGAAGTSSPAAAPSAVPASSGAEILRFSIGAYDLTPTIGTVATSSIAPDGTFLLTGDRSYPASGTSMRETFYFLCRPGPDGVYRLFADVAQSPENDRSACRRLARLGAVKGVTAGDQVLFRAADGEGQIYLLLRLFGPTVTEGTGR